MIPRLLRARNACVYCQGDGKCAECDGTGINPHLNEDEPKCRNCGGSGICPNCSGSGVMLLIGGGPAIQDLGLDKTDEK